MSLHDDCTISSTTSGSVPGSPVREKTENGMFDDLNMTEIAHIISIPGNDKCVDCSASRPEWASLGFGVLVCLDCAGYHRSLGVHISLVRSLKMDSWSSVQKRKLLTGGNRKFLDYINNLKTRDRLNSTTSSGSRRSESSGNNVTAMHNNYMNPEVVYYREVVQAECDNRLAVEYNPTFWTDAVNPLKSHKHQLMSQSSSPKWAADDDASECMLCGIPFTFIRRRHHCRRCGKCVCKICAPTDNTRPILEWGMLDPVRHCKDCYMNPMLNWG